MANIFHFSNKPPFPLKDGGCIAIAGILRSLLSHPKHTVFHFTLKTHKHPFQQGAYPKEWIGKMQMDRAKIKTTVSIFGAVKHLIINKSYNVSRFYDKAVVQKLRKHLSHQQFDVAILESIFLLPYLSIFQEFKVSVIVRTHNVEHKIWEDLAAHSSFLKKWYYNKLARQLKKYEMEQLKKVDGILAISEEDLQFFEQHFPTVRKIHLPVPQKTSFPMANYRYTDFYFLGAMDWFPNQEGVEWFLKNVIPEGLDNNTFYLAGKNLKTDDYQHKNVEVVGEVDNAVSFIEKHGICVIPLLSGSGVKIKLLENMAMGKPIITTSEGARGVQVEHEKHVLITDDPQQFRIYMNELSKNERKRKELGRNAKKFIVKNYGNKELTQQLNEFIAEK